jgi:hypothetical protein
MNPPLDLAQRRTLRPPARHLWGHVRREFLYLAWAVMEVSLLMPIALSFMAWASAWPPQRALLWLVLLLLFAFNLIRLQSMLGVPRDTGRWVMVIAAFLTAVLSIRILLYEVGLFDLSWLVTLYQNFTEAENTLWQRDVTLFLLVSYTWWRGMLLATRQPDILRLGFRIRLAVLLGAPLAIAAVASARLAWSVLPYVLLYFMAALTAVALTRTEQVEREQHALISSITPRWLLVVFLTSLFTVLVAGGTAVGINAATAEDLAPFSFLWHPIRFGGSVVGLTLAFLLSPLLEPLNAALEWLVAFWRRAFLALFESAETTEESPNLFAQYQQWLEEVQRQSQVGDPVVNWRLVVIIVIIFVVILALLAVGRMYQRRRMEDDYLARHIGGGVFGLDRERPGLAQRLLDQLGLLRRWRAASSIRRIYANMCRAAAASGYPRADAETPYEYLAALREVWPEQQDDTALITGAFVRVRYGEVPETEAELEAIREAWRRLEARKPWEEQGESGVE